MLFRLSGLLLLVIALSGCAEPPYSNLDNEQLETMLGRGVPIYDIRRAEEWHQTGVIEGSRLQTFVDVSGRVLPDFLAHFSRTIDKDDPVILICRTGNRRTDEPGRRRLLAAVSSGFPKRESRWLRAGVEHGKSMRCHMFAIYDMLRDQQHHPRW